MAETLGSRADRPGALVAFGPVVQGEGAADVLAAAAAPAHPPAVAAADRTDRRAARAAHAARPDRAPRGASCARCSCPTGRARASSSACRPRRRAADAHAGRARGRCATTWPSGSRTPAARCRDRTYVEEKHRRRIEEMLLAPEEHKWVRVGNEDIGEPGCKHWHVTPRWGILGMLLNWWRVKISTGCPLATGHLRPVASSGWESGAASAREPSRASPAGAAAPAPSATRRGASARGRRRATGAPRPLEAAARAHVDRRSPAAPVGLRSRSPSWSSWPASS